MATSWTSLSSPCDQRRRDFGGVESWSSLPRIQRDLTAVPGAMQLNQERATSPAEYSRVVAAGPARGKHRRYQYRARTWRGAQSSAGRTGINDGSVAGR